MGAEETAAVDLLAFFGWRIANFFLSSVWSCKVLMNFQDSRIYNKMRLTVCLVFSRTAVAAVGEWPSSDSESDSGWAETSCSQIRS